MPERLAERAQSGPPHFKSYFMAGFECSSHRRNDGVRLDLIRATAHYKHAEADYAACASLGLHTVRDGLRWHLIEQVPGKFDWSSWLPMLDAAEEAGVQVIWDMLHYGAPDHLDQGSDAFIDAYGRFAAEAVKVHFSAVGRAPLVCPINEISFFAWAVEVGYFPAVGPRKLGWFKRHLVRTAISGTQAMRSAVPSTRFVFAEPLIHVAQGTGIEARCDGPRHLETGSSRRMTCSWAGSSPSLVVMKASWTSSG